MSVVKLDQNHQQNDQKSQKVNKIRQVCIKSSTKLAKFGKKVNNIVQPAQKRTAERLSKADYKFCAISCVQVWHSHALELGAAIRQVHRISVAGHPA